MVLRLAAVCGAAGCAFSEETRTEEKTGPTRTVSADLISDVAYAGCDRLYTGPRCELTKPRTLTLWVEADPKAQLTLEVAGKPVSAEWLEIDTGLRTQVEVAPDAGSVVIRASLDNGEDRFVMAIRRLVRPAALEEAHRRHDEDATKALSLLDTIDAGDDIALQSDIATIRSKVAFDLEDYDGTIEHSSMAAKLATRAGLEDKAIQDLASVVFVASQVRHDPELTQRYLEQMDAIPREAFAQATYDYYFARFNNLIGKRARAQQLLERARRIFQRVDQTLYANSCAYKQSTILSTLGRHAAAARILDTVVTSTSGCSEAFLDAAKAWVGVLAREVEVDVGIDRIALAYGAADALSACGNEPERINALITGALASIQDSDLQRAADTLTQTEDSDAELPMNVRTWQLVARARLAQRQQRWRDAHRAYEALGRLANSRGLSSAKWRALAGLATTYARAGQTKRAIDLFAEAEETLDAMGGVLVLPSSLSVLTFAQDRAARLYASMLLDVGRSSAALDVLERQSHRRIRQLARRARLSALPREVRERWNDLAAQYAQLRTQSDRASEDAWLVGATVEPTQRRHETERRQAELASILHRAVELLDTHSRKRKLASSRRAEWLQLGYDQTDKGTVAFARLGRELRVLELSRRAYSGTPTDLSSRLLIPFKDLVERERNVEIIARGPFAALDFHAMPYGEGLFLDVAKVTYSAETPLPSRDGPASAGPPVIIADPDGTLPRARDEGAEVRRQLKKIAHPARLLVGDQVERSTVLSAMETSLLHWAGHTRIHADDFSLVEERALPLSQRSKLTMTDILTLPTVPTRVVLTACEAAPRFRVRMEPTTAFLIAGTKEVVAAIREVRDADAHRLATALYASQGSLDLPTRLRDAQRQLRGTHADWAAFRVFVP